MSDTPTSGESTEGVWAAYGWDWNAHLIGVYPSEVEALRAAVENSGHAMFLPWGMSFAEAADDAATYCQK